MPQILCHSFGWQGPHIGLQANTRDLCTAHLSISCSSNPQILQASSPHVADKSPTSTRPNCCASEIPLFADISTFAGAFPVSSLGGFWACGPRSPPEGPKQRRRERKEGNGDARSSSAGPLFFISPQLPSFSAKAPKQCPGPPSLPLLFRSRCRDP